MPLPLAVLLIVACATGVGAFIAMLIDKSVRSREID
jgi:hypothetical protein